MNDAPIHADETGQVHPENGRFLKWGGFQGFRHGFLRLFAIGAHINPYPVQSASVGVLGFHLGFFRVGGARGYLGAHVGIPFFYWGFMLTGEWARPTGRKVTDEERQDHRRARRAAAEQMLADDREHTLRHRRGNAEGCSSTVHEADKPTPTGAKEID